MRGICHMKIGLFAIIIAVIHVGVTVCALAEDQGALNQGVPISDIDRVRQENRPFVIINELLVLDPARNEIILLFPEEKVERIVQPEIPAIETEKRVIHKTHSETEIGTITIETK